MKRGQRERLGLIQQGFEPEQAGHLDFLKWLHRRKPKRSLSRRQASKRGVDMWQRLPKERKPSRRPGGKPPIIPGPGSGLI